MKRILFFAIVILLLSGCAPSLNEPVAPEEGIDVIAAENRNVVVKEPTKGQPTREIDERLVGRYVARKTADEESDLAEESEAYFEIRPDGTAEISLNTPEGTVYYAPEDIEIIVFYAESTSVFVHLNLVGGNQTYPDKYGLSLPLVGNTGFASFTLASFWSDHRLDFDKQS